jgi:hypothetical protein
MCRIIKRSSPAELMDAIYRAEGWRRAEGESRTKRVNAAYVVTVDARANRYIATRKECP